MNTSDKEIFDYLKEKRDEELEHIACNLSKETLETIRVFEKVLDARMDCELLFEDEEGSNEKWHGLFQPIFDELKSIFQETIENSSAHFPFIIDAEHERLLMEGCNKASK